MESDPIKKFLAHHHKTRLVEYLDPIRESLSEALERKLRWAKVNRHRAAFRDEATFLLRNAFALRQAMRGEESTLDQEDDWIEPVAASGDLTGTVWSLVSEDLAGASKPERFVLPEFASMRSADTTPPPPYLAGTCCAGCGDSLDHQVAVLSFERMWVCRACMRAALAA